MSINTYSCTYKHFLTCAHTNIYRLNKLLPPSAPLSTLRIITASSFPLQVHQRGAAHVPTSNWREYIRPLSAVRYRGRHDAIYSNDQSHIFTL